MSIYRFKLDDSVVEEITAFAKIHQYDTKHDYKKAWTIWCEDNNEIVRKEIDRLNELGYDGNSLDKMYKAGRYYFRKKQLNAVSKPKQRRIYLNMDTLVLDAMDKHIMDNVRNPDFTPSNGYDWFCNQYYTILKNEIMRIVTKNNSITSSVLIIKIKKTYKNRYFLYTKE